MDVSELLVGMPPEVAKRLKSGTLKPPNSEEYLEARKNWANAEPGNLTGCDCPLCKNRGYTTEIKQGVLVSVGCPCMAKRRSLRCIERSGMKELLDTYTFASFKTDEPWQAEMKRRAEDFLKNGAGRWFAAMGSVGAGKTHICTAICGELLSEGREVRYMLWRDESVKIKAAVSNVDEYNSLIEPLKTAPILYIDDLFKTQKGGPITQADVNLAFELLNFRYCNKKLTTIISSEKTIDEIMGIDEAVGSRIYERCKGYYLKLTGNKNRRLA